MAPGMNLRSKDKVSDDLLPNNEKPNSEKPNNEKPNAKKPNAKKPDNEKPNAKKPNNEKPNAKKPNTQKPKKPDNEKPNAKKPNTQKPKKPDNEKSNDKQPAKKTGGRKKAASEVDPEAFNKKLEEIARLENATAAAYADNTTPGGQPLKTNAKGGRKAAAPKPAKAKGRKVISDTSDAEQTIGGSETEVDGSVKRKGSKRADRSYRDAITSIRTKLDLVPIGEDDEGDTDPGAVLKKGVQNIARDQDNNHVEGISRGQEESGVEEIAGYWKESDVEEVAGHHDVEEVAGHRDVEEVAGREEESDIEEVAGCQKESDVEEVAGHQEESDVEEVAGHQEESDLEEVAERREESDLEEVAERREEESNGGDVNRVRDNSKGPGVREKSPVRSKMNDNDLEILHEKSQQRTSKDDVAPEGRVKNKGPDRKGKGKAVAEVVTEDRDVEMHDIDPEPLHKSRTLKRQHVVESGSESDEPATEKPPSQKKSRSVTGTAVAQGRKGTTKTSAIKKQVPLPTKPNKRDNDIVMLVSDDDAAKKVSGKKSKASPAGEEREGRKKTTAGNAKHKAKETGPKKDKLTHLEIQKSRRKPTTPGSQMSQMSSSSGALQSSNAEGSRTASKRQIVESDDDGLTSKKRRTNSSSDEENSDDGDSEFGGLSEHDERSGDERRFAEQSPFKGRKRLNSQALVKVENTNKREKVPRSRVTNQHLAEELRVNELWTKKVLPTLFRWFAAQENPWTANPENLEASLQLICRHFVGEDYTLAEGASSPEFQLALQRLSDAWRNPIKAAALMSVIGFFDSNEKYFGESNEKRKQWAILALDQNRFSYGVVESVKVRGKKELLLDKPFQHQLILHTFAAHFTSIKKATWIEGLPFVMDQLPRAALALSTTAVEWALLLWTKGYITVDKVRAAEKSTTKSKMLKVDYTPKKNGRGSETKYYAAFSANECSVKTLNYLKSVQLLTFDEMQTVMNLSRGLAKAHSRAVELEDDDDDPRGHLCGRTFNDSEIESACSDDEDMPGFSKRDLASSKGQ